MSNSVLDAFLHILLGSAGKEELERVKQARREQELEDRDANIEKMKQASEGVTANMSPARQKMIEKAMSVQRNSEQRVFENVSEEQKQAMKEDALDQVFGAGGGLKGDE